MDLYNKKEYYLKSNYLFQYHNISQNITLLIVAHKCILYILKVLYKSNSE